MNKLPQRISLFALSITFVVAVSHQPSGQAKNASGQTPATNTSPVTVNHADELARALQLFPAKWVSSMKPFRNTMQF